MTDMQGGIGTKNSIDVAAAYGGLPPRPLNILALHAATGSRFYRVIPQLNWMHKQGHNVQLEPHDSKHLDHFLDWCDVLVLQMVFSQDLVKRAKAAGKTVIFECDDLIHRTHAKHYSYKETKGIKNQVRWLWRIWRTLRLCDGLIVTNEKLKRVYGWMVGGKTLVFPNYMELSHWLKEPKKNPTDRVRILWAGSTSHTGDLEWFKPVIGRILEKYPQVQFIYIGHGGVPTEDLYARFVYGEDIFEGLPMHRRESMLSAPPNIFPYTLASLMADIAVAPLEKNSFNSYKTQCKYLEYGINGIPAVYAKWFYTDVKSPPVVPVWPPFVDGPTHLFRGTGLLADTPDEWVEALSLLIENAMLRKQIGEKARREVIEKYNFADHAPRWQGFVELAAGYESTHHPRASSPQVRSQR